MSAKKMIAGLLAGVAAGAMLSLFLTKRGSGIRKKMYKRGSDMADALKESFSNWVDKAQSKMESIR